MKERNSLELRVSNFLYNLIMTEGFITPDLIDEETWRPAALLSSDPLLPPPCVSPESVQRNELQAVLKVTTEYSSAVRDLSLLFQDEPKTVVSAATKEENGIKAWIDWSLRIDRLVVSPSL